MTSVSTLSFNNQTRVALSRLQRELNDVGNQVANDGRLNDVGKTLGRLTGSSVSARSVSDTMKEQQTSNGIIDRRLKTGEAAMSTISEGANSLADNLLVAKYGTVDFVSLATSGLAQMTNALNSTDAGTYVFGGIQSEKRPIADYENSPAKTAATASFNAFVLASTGGTDASAVTADDMKLYLTTGYIDGAIPAVTHTYNDLFNDANWKTNWSNAASDKGQARINGTETVTSAGSANDAAFRSVASGYAMIIDIDVAFLNDKARAVVLNSAQSALRTGTAGITTLGAAVGTTRKRIETANTELQRQQDIMTNTVEALETEDISALGVKAKALQTNLDTAYALTAKIQNLSILDYL